MYSFLCRLPFLINLLQFSLLLAHSISDPRYSTVESPSSSLLSAAILLQDDDVVQLSCLGCSNNEISKQRRLLAIRNDILAKLGMAAPPNVTRRSLSKIPPLEPILDSYGEMQSDRAFRPVDDDTFRPEKIISFGGPVPPEFGFAAVDGALYFTISPKIRLNLLDKTSVWVYVKEGGNSLSSRQTNITVKLYTMHPINTNHGQVPELRERDAKIKQNPYRGQWIRFDLRKIFSRWLEDPVTNYGIVIRAEDFDGTNLAVTQPDGPQEMDYAPVLEVRMDDETKRIRRGLPFDCRESAPERYCCRYPLQVNFGEFGVAWDFIIAPRSYEAYYCSGECKNGFNPQNNHAHFRYSLTGAIPGPCCTASKTSDLMMLYVDDRGNVVYGTIPSMVVNRCGCA